MTRDKAILKCCGIPDLELSPSVANASPLNGEDACVIEVRIIRNNIKWASRKIPQTHFLTLIKIQRILKLINKSSLLSPVLVLWPNNLIVNCCSAGLRKNAVRAFTCGHPLRKYVFMRKVMNILP